MKNVVFLMCVALLAGCGEKMVTKDETISMLSPEVMKSDLDLALKTIEEVHPNMYAYISKDEFCKLRDKAYRELDRPMNDLEYYKVIASLVAEIRNGHTNVWPNEKVASVLKSQITTGYPIEIDSYRDYIFIKGYYGLLDLPTGEIVEINNENAMDCLKRICRYKAVEYKNYNFAMVEKAGLAALIWLDGGEIGALSLKVKSEDGKIHDLRIEPIDISEIKKAALLKQEAGKQYHKFDFRHDEENNVGVMTIKTFNSQSMEEFKTFLKKHFDYMREKNIKNLIIDIRDNPGGSTNVSQELVKYLTDKPFKMFSKVSTKLSKHIEGTHRGKIKDEDLGKVMEYNSGDISVDKSHHQFDGKAYLLINGNTFSTALDLAVVLQHYNLAVLVGDETSDTPSGYGDVFSLELPNTKMRLGVSIKYFEALGDKKDGHGVVPEYEVRQSGVDTAKGVDTVMEFTLGMIKNSRSESCDENGE